MPARDIASQALIVKICGITRLSDARAAFALGADWIGLNLVQGPRMLSQEAALSIVTALDRPDRVVLLMRADDGKLDDAALSAWEAVGIRRLQLYGRVTSSAAARLAARRFAFLLVQPCEGPAFVRQATEMVSSCGTHVPEFLLLDGAVGGALGGRGKRADWDAIEAANRTGATRALPPIMLAGGLTPENVSEAVRQVRPVGVDVSSGVESSPGIKDEARMEQFIRAARNSTIK